MSKPFSFPPYAEISQVMDWLRTETGESRITSETELRSIIALMPHPLFIKNADSQIVMMNPACEALWGVRFADAAGTDGSGKLPPEQVLQFREHDRQAFASGQTRTDEVLVWNVSQREMRWLLVHKRPTYDHLGQPHLLIASCIDITGRKQKEAALEETLRQWQQLALQQLDATESQHRRIALGMQGDLAQSLLALKLDITLLHGRTATHQPLLHARAEQALTTLSSSIAAVREVINELHPATLELGLAAALEWQLQHHQGVPCSLRVLDDSAALTSQQTMALFHLTNAAIDYLSAQASALQLTLNLQRDLVTITISGDGAAAANTPTLNAMRERLAGLGGALAVTQSNGTTLTMTVSA